MNKQKTSPGFMIVVFDQVAQTFSVEGPIYDESRCRDAIAVTRVKGRDIGFVSYHEGSASQWRRSAAETFRATSKFKRVAIGSIIGFDLRDTACLKPRSDLAVMPPCHSIGTASE